jgi:hypothetical protein
LFAVAATRFQRRWWIYVPPPLTTGTGTVQQMPVSVDLPASALAQRRERQGQFLLAILERFQIRVGTRILTCGTTAFLSWSHSIWLLSHGASRSGNVVLVAGREENSLTVAIAAAGGGPQKPGGGLQCPLILVTAVAADVAA